MAARTRSRVSIPTPGPSLRTADTVALDTPVWRATSEMVGRFPVIARSADEILPNQPERCKTGSAAEHTDPVSSCQVRLRDAAVPILGPPDSQRVRAHPFASAGISG